MFTVVISTELMTFIRKTGNLHRGTISVRMLHSNDIKVQLGVYCTAVFYMNIMSRCFVFLRRIFSVGCLLCDN